MATLFLSGGAPRSIFRVVMLKGGKWSPYSNYHKYVDAEMTAAGLITGGHKLPRRAEGESRLKTPRAWKAFGALARPALVDALEHVDQSPLGKSTASA
jgi:hypothetical protein